MAYSAEDNLLTFLESFDQSVRLADRKKLLEKFAKIRADGVSNFQVISDFDKTLTPQWLKDNCKNSGVRRQCQASHGVVEFSPLVSEKYRKIAHDLAVHYIPLELDHSLPIDKRTEFVSEWYAQAHDAMLDEKLTLQKLRIMVENSWCDFDIHLREGSKSMFAIARDYDIPVTVLSAGLRDVIELILVLENILDIPSDWRDLETDHPVMVVSNIMTFNENGDHTGFVDPVIHALSKKHALHEFLLQSNERSKRQNALVMGDLIADVDFVQSIPHLGECITVGFLGDPIEGHVTQDYNERICDYLEHFDIVILGGCASMEVPVQLLRAICNE